MTIQPGTSRAEEPEPIVEPGHDLLDRHRAQPDRGQFKGQRDSVESPAHRDHGLLIRRGEGESGHHRFGPVHEERHRLTSGRGSAGIGYVHGRDQQGVLRHDVERLSAGRQDPQPRRRPQQRLGQLRAPIDQVLAGVQDQQEMPVGQTVREQIQRVTGGLVGQADAGCHGTGQQLRIAQRGQLDQPHPVVEGPAQIGGHTQGQPGLPHPARAAQGDQPRPFESLPDLCQLPLPSDEPGHLGREIARPPFQRENRHGRLG